MRHQIILSSNVTMCPVFETCLTLSGDSFIIWPFLLWDCYLTCKYRISVVYFQSTTTTYYLHFGQFLNQKGGNKKLWQDCWIQSFSTKYQIIVISLVIIPSKLKSSEKWESRNNLWLHPWSINPKRTDQNEDEIYQHYSYPLVYPSTYHNCDATFLLSLHFLTR